MGRKGVKGLWLVGQEKVSHGLGVRTGDLGDTAVGAGNLRRPASLAQMTGKDQGLAEPQTSIFFLGHSTPDWPDWAKGGRQNCVYEGVLKGL